MSGSPRRIGKSSSPALGKGEWSHLRDFLQSCLAAGPKTSRAGSSAVDSEMAASRCCTNRRRGFRRTQLPMISSDSCSRRHFILAFGV